MSQSRESEITSVEELLAVQKKEKKELMAKTQKMKHSVPKGDKKKKKEVTAEIAQMLADLDSKHEKEMEELEKSFSCTEKSESLEENVKDSEATTSKDTESTSEKNIGVTKEEEFKNKDITKEGDANQEGMTSSVTSSKSHAKSSIQTEGDVIPKEKTASKEGDVTKEECVTKERLLTEKSTLEEKSITRVGSDKRKVVDSPADSPTDSPADSPEKVDVDSPIKVVVPAPRISKAQKRRNKKALLEKERNRSIAEQDIENLKGLRHIESVEILNKLSQRKLTIYEIPSDGNCLYKAVEHQLSVLKLKETTVQALRQQTSEYMLMHIQDYLPFLTSPETGDILTEKQYAQYCEDIAKTPAWGGHIEIQVMSRILGYPIEVVQGQGPSIIAGDEKSGPKLILSYHRHAYGLGEHYNSVIPITSKK